MDFTDIMVSERSHTKRIHIILFCLCEIQKQVKLIVLKISTDGVFGGEGSFSDGEKS